MENRKRKTLPIDLYFLFQSFLKRFFDFFVNSFTPKSVTLSSTVPREELIFLRRSDYGKKE